VAANSSASRALIGEPEAILADEPTEALDSENGSSIMAILCEVPKDPAHGVLVVTATAETTALIEPHRSRPFRTCP
jgi:ABC-type lipoprotein export system ATPase subunit